MVMTVEQFLIKHSDACVDAKEWLRDFFDPEAEAEYIWEVCNRPDWLVWAAGMENQKWPWVDTGLAFLAQVLDEIDMAHSLSDLDMSEDAKRKEIDRLYLCTHNLGLHNALYVFRKTKLDSVDLVWMGDILGFLREDTETFDDEWSDTLRANIRNPFK